MNKIPENILYHHGFIIVLVPLRFECFFSVSCYEAVEKMNHSRCFSPQSFIKYYKANKEKNNSSHRHVLSVDFPGMKAEGAAAEWKVNDKMRFLNGLIQGVCGIS